MIAAADENDRRQFGRGVHRVAALLIAVDQVDAVVDADADERHDGEHGKQIELHAGERQHAGGPGQADRRRQQRVAATAASRGTRATTSSTTSARSDRQALEELRQETPRQLAVDQREAGQRLRRIDRR